MDCFKDRVVIITGASSGIGAGTAFEFAKYGAKVVLVARSKEGLENTAKECQKVGLPEEKILIVAADVTKEGDIKRIVDESVEKFGHIHILVNNAGKTIKGTFEESTLGQLDETLDLNVRAVYALTKATLPYLQKTKGCIINLSSIAGVRPLSHICAYSMSKAAVEQFTQALAVELAPQGIRVNAVAPGVIVTDIFTRPGGLVSDPSKVQKFLEWMASAHPMNRVGQVEEVAQAILFLCSDSASFITGSILPIDGGRHATTWLPK